MNYLLTRVKPYNPNGRHQTESESDKVAEDLRNLLHEQSIPYVPKDGDKDGYDEIIQDVINKLFKLGVLKD